MKILVVHSFWHARGGDWTSLSTLSDALEAAGHTVIPFAMRHPDNAPSAWEGWFAPWNADARADGVWSLRAAAAVSRLVRAHRPDVAHAHHLHRHLTPSVLGALRRLRVPTVWTLHDHELVCPTGLAHAAGDPPGAECSRCDAGFHHAVIHRCKRAALAPSAAVALEHGVHAALGVRRAADRFLTPSRFLLDRLAARGVPAERLRHVPNPVVAPREAPLDPSGPVVFAGRLTPEKGVEDVLAAARRLPDAPFVIAGGFGEPGGDTPRNVRYVGHLDGSALGRLIASASVVLTPSRWPENDPYAVLEPMAAGRAVVACRVGGIPEQIDHAVDGWLVEPGNPAALASAVARLRARPDEMVRLGTNARVRVARERDPAHIAGRVAAIYRELIR